MDLLGTVLLTLQVTDSSIVSFELGTPWGLAIPAQSHNFPIIFSPVDAPCWLTMTGGAPVCVEPGDSALILSGRPFVTQSSLDAPVTGMHEAWFGQGLQTFDEAVSERRPVQFRWQPAMNSCGAVHRILSVTLALRDAAHHPVLRLLPDMILVRQSEGQIFPWPAAVMQFLLNEQLTSTPGYEVTTRHLATLIFTSLVRAHVVLAGASKASWLRGLSDARIGRALTLMHQTPEQPWTIATLAGECGMSRTNLARKFMTLVGQPPMAYLSELRMMEAARQLTAGTPAGVVAGNVGYSSDWAFRRAFILRYGVTPARFGRGDRNQRPRHVLQDS